MTKRILLAITIISGLFIASGVFADTSPKGCETNTMKGGELCSWSDGGKSWCGGNTFTCSVEPTGACPSNPSNGTYAFDCNTCGCVLTCDSGFSKCGSSCVANCTPGSNCSACDTCTSNNCTACNAGYELIAGACTAAPIKLSTLSNVGGFIKQVISPTLTLDSVGNLAPSGDLQMTSNKSVALTAVGTTSLWFGNYNGATGFTYGSGDVASIAVEGDVKGNRLCFQDDCRADWASVSGSNVWSRTNPYLYPTTLTDNVGIGTTTPSFKLDVSGTFNFQLDPVRYFRSNSNGGVGLTRTDSTGWAMSYGFLESNGTTIGGYGYNRNSGQYFVGPSYTSPYMVIASSTGSVGIGTTNPVTNLVITGTAPQTLYQTAGTGGTISDGFKFGLDSAAISYIWNWENTDMYFGTNGQTRAIIKAGGNVGIGTTAPNDIFSIGNSGSAPAGSLNTGHNFTSTYLTTDDYALANYGIVKTLLNTANLWSGTKNGNIWNGDAGVGNVGIGITNPKAGLAINKEGYPLNLGGGAAGAGDMYLLHNAYYSSGFVNNALQFKASATHGSFGYRGISFSYLGGISFYASTAATTIDTALTPTEVLRITNSGNVGIGTTTPSSKLHIYGVSPVLSIEDTGQSSGATIQFRNLYSGSIYTGSISSSFLGSGMVFTVPRDINQGGFRFKNAAGSEVFVINTQSGNVGIGSIFSSTVLAGSKLSVVGNAAIGTNYATSSAPANGMIVEGSVGVGTTTPAFSLVVSGKADGLNKAVVGNIEIGDWDTAGGYTGYAMIKHKNVSVSNYAFIQDGSGNTYFNAASQLNFGLGANGRLRLEAGGSGYIFGPRANNVVDLGTSSLYYAKTYTTNLYTSGNVGIGTTNPTALLTLGNGGILVPNGNIDLSSGGISVVRNSANTGLSVTQNGTGLIANFLDGANSVMAITDGGNVGIGTTAPNDSFSIGNSGSAPAGSSNTGHNYTSTYLSTDDYALANYGVVKTLIAAATSSLPTGVNFWGGTKNDNIWNGDAGAGNVGIGTTNPTFRLSINSSATNTAGLLVYGGTSVGAANAHAGQLILGNLANDQGLFSFDANGGSLYIDNSYDTASTGLGNIFFRTRTNGTAINALMIQGISGNVGIGITDPTHQLELNKSLELAATTDSDTGVIYKGTLRFIHDFTGSGTFGGNIFIGKSAGNFTMGGSNSYDASYNTGVGEAALAGLTTGRRNVAVGNNAMPAGSNANIESVAVGYIASYNSSSGSGNATFGSSAGYTMVSASYNTFIGQKSGYYTTGGSNTILGTEGGYGATGSSYANSTLLGKNAGHDLTSGSNNILIGYQAGDIITSGANNIVIGYDIDAPSDTSSNQLTIGNIIFGTGLTSTGKTISTGNIGIGTSAPNDKFSIGNAGNAAPAGSSNTGHNYTSTYLSTDDYALANYGIVKTLINAATSSSALWGGATGANIWNLNSTGNVGIGLTNPSQQLELTKSIKMVDTTSSDTGVIYKSTYSFLHNYGTRQVFLGASAGNFTMTGTDNVAVGAFSLSTNTTGGGNVAVGRNALNKNTTGANVAVGTYAMQNNATGTSNVAIGSQSMNNNTGGNFNTAVGQSALDANTTGSINVALGNDSLGANLTGNFNVAVGNNAAANNTTGSNNVSIGYFSGSYQADGSTSLNNIGNSIYIGTNVRGYNNSDNNSIVIGSSAIGIGANTVVLGNNSIVTTALKGNVGIGVTNPNDAFSIGNGGSVAPAGSSNTGHNYTSTYLSTDDYALANYGIIKTLIAAATSSLPTGVNFWGGTKNGSIWNGDAGVGNVGIGTTNPGQKLSVYGGRINVRDVTPSGYSVLEFGNDTTALLGGFFAAGSTASGYGGANSLNLINIGPGPLALGTDNSVDIVIKTGGNVGIGLTNPIQKLDVAGIIRSDSRVMVESALGTSAMFTVDEWNSGESGMYYNSGQKIATYHDFDGLYQYANGIIYVLAENVGIGTTEPNDILSIGNGGSGAPAGSANTGHNYTSTYLSTDDYALANYGVVKTLIAAATSSLPTGVNFWGGTKNGSIWNGDAGAGNVGIGTTNPTQNLQVVGKAVFGPSTAADSSSLFSFNGVEPRLNWGATLNLNDTSPLAVGIGSRILMGSTYNSGGTVTGGVAFGAYKESAVSGTYGYAFTISTRPNGGNVTERMRIDSTGNVGIGTTTIAQRLSLDGSMSLPRTIDGSSGVIYKGAVSFIHDFTAAGTSGANVFIGKQAGNFSMSGSNSYDASFNTGIGDGALGGLSTGRRNVAIGYNSMVAANNANIESTAVGWTSSYNSNSGTGNASFGAGAGYAMVSSSYNTFIGQRAGYYTTGGSNTIVGNEGGYGATGSSYSNSALLGKNAGHDLSSGSNNILIGYQAGDIITSGANNIVIGYDIDAPNDTGSNQLVIGNLIFGTGLTSTGKTISTGNIGIGTSAPNDKFSIGNGGNAAPAGSSNTGHNYTSTYLSTDDYALANYGIVKTLIGSATSTLSGNFLPLAGGTMLGDVNFGAKNITNLNNLTVSKITATTIDPLYTINNVNYSTFAPSISGGVKEEYVGKADIIRKNAARNEYEYIINFSLEDEGSDLWLWRKVVDYSNDNVQVFITPSGQFAQVYYQIDGNRLIFRSDKPAEISYRLIGKRYDWRAWPTRALNQGDKGVIVE